MIVIVLWLFLTVALVAMQCVIVVFLDHIHLIVELFYVQIRWCLFMEAVI